jgi:hypothetical protein
MTIEKEFNKLFPNHENDLKVYREFMVNKYGEELVMLMDEMSNIAENSLMEFLEG